MNRNLTPDPGRGTASPAEPTDVPMAAIARKRPVTMIVFSLVAYLLTVVTAALAPRLLAPGGALEVFLLVPMLTTLLMVCIIYWVYRTSDEYIRQRILKCAALTGGILAFSTVGYFCLERLGHPPLSMIVVNLYGWAVFMVLILWVLSRAR
ncbi:MAG TPA: hypothetical protein VGG49_08055 [Steroidobacteraceae bacterium]|jgi:hypothetical protein